LYLNDWLQKYYRLNVLAYSFGKTVYGMRKTARAAELLLQNDKIVNIPDFEGIESNKEIYFCRQLRLQRKILHNFQ